MIVILLIFSTKDSHHQLPQTQRDSSAPKQGIGIFLIEKAHGDDKEYGDCTGNRVEEVELSDGDVVEGGELLLHGLRLVENEVVSEHHQDQKDPQMDFFHLNIIYLQESREISNESILSLCDSFLPNCNYLK